MSEPSPMTPAATEPPPLISPQGRRVLGFVLRRWWVLVLGAAFCGGLGAFHALNRAATFEVASRMWVGGTLRIPEGAFFTEELQNLFGTQAELMKSEQIRQSAHKAVVGKHPLFEGAEPPEVEILQPRKTSLFLLRVNGPDRAYLVDYLNALMDEYLAYRRDARVASSEESLQSLTTELTRQATELRLAEERLVAFQATNNAVVLEQEGVSAGNYLARLQLDQAQLRLEYELLGAMIDGGMPSSGFGTAVGGNRLANLGLTSAAGAASAMPGNVRDVDSAYQYVQMLKVQRDDLGQFLKDKHPKMVKLDEEIVRGEKLMTVLRDQSLEQLKSTHETLGRRVKSLDLSAAAWEVRVLELNRRMADFTRLKTEVARAQSLHDRLLDVTQGLDLNKKLDQVTVSVLDRATVLPGGNSWKPWTAGSGAAGFLGALAILGLIALRDDRIRSPEELSGRFSLEILGQIPAVPSHRNERLAPVTPDDDRFAFIESFRALRSALLFLAPPENRPRTLLITSARPGEGKSTVALNLARTLAFAGSRVLLIDGDLRRGTLHEQVGAASAPGLAEVVEGGLEPDRAIQSNGLPHLTFLPAGAGAAATGEIFLHRRFDDLILESVKQCDFVILDSAPLLATADTATLAPRVDAVLLVVREGETRSASVAQAIDLLNRRQANVIGVVYNAATAGRRGRGFYEDAAYQGARPASKATA